MLQSLSISKQNPQFPAYLDFQVLRQIGIEHLQRLSGRLWTDYNLHDPGITILEVLCYAVTDLGYRNNLDIEDLLALKPGAPENNFFTPDQILTCNPVTPLDIRKRLIDIAGVHNAWLEKVTDYDPPIWIDPVQNQLQLTPATGLQLHPRGLYTVYLDLDPDYHRNACGELTRSWSEVLDEVKAVLCRDRNLCEDIHDIVILDEEEIRLCADIELAPDADGEAALVEIYGQIQAFLVPHIQFYTLPQLLEKKQDITAIFAGRPSQGDDYHSHGFIDTDDLDQLMLPQILHTSDFYQKILDVSGVAAIKNLLIASSINGLNQSQESPWYLQLTPYYRPVLSVEQSRIRLFKNGLPVPVNLAEVQRRYYEQRSAQIKIKRKPYELDLAVPAGRYAENLASHYSIHHDFPVAYGISEAGLSEPISARREAQVKQLQGYLAFFDQLLANYLAQLSQVREVFTWDASTQTSFNQPIQFPGAIDILEPDYLSAIAPDPETERDRRDRALDHLLARFAESFTDYVLFNYNTQPEKLMQEKAQFVQDYPHLSRDRFRAANYYDADTVWDTDRNISGFKQRVARLLGMDTVCRQNLNHYAVVWDPGGFRIEVGLLQSRKVYPTQADAQIELDIFLGSVLCANYYQLVNYGDREFSYALVAPTGTMLAESQRFNSAIARNDALYQWLSKIRAGNFDQTQAIANSNLPAIAVVPEQDQFEFVVEQNQFVLRDRALTPLLRSQKTYATASEAWQAAYACSENLFYFKRYGQTELVDANRQVIAQFAEDPLTLFKRLNRTDALLQVAPIPVEAETRYRCQLNDRAGNVLLQATQIFETQDRAIDRFYQDVLGMLFEPQLRYSSATRQGFSFGVLGRPGDSSSKVAIHPQVYATAAERDAIVNQLFLLIRTNRLPFAIAQTQAPGYVGQIADLRTTERFEDAQKAWEQGDRIMELMGEDGQNFRAIESSGGLCGWELRDGDTSLATQIYPNKDDRDAAIKQLHQLANHQGFHVLEHILLRPRRSQQASHRIMQIPLFWWKGYRLLPERFEAWYPSLLYHLIFDETLEQLLPINVRAEMTPYTIAQSDPYSFWVSIVLPYWPEQFRNFNFRRFVERTLRLEAPAHIALKIAWVNVQQMDQFETAYQYWLAQLVQTATEGTACDLVRAQNQLVTILTQLRSIYPQGTLSSAQAAPKNPIVLNQTVLGSAKESSL